MKIKMICMTCIIIAAMIISGCAQRLKANINAYTSKTESSQIVPGSKIAVVENDKAANPLLEEEVKIKIGKILEKKGYSVVPIEKADYLLFYGYGMGGPRSIDITVPKVGVGYFASSSGTKIYSLTTGTGHRQATMHDRWLLINVVDAKQLKGKDKPKAVWVGDTTSSGTSSDMRTVINYLLATTFEYFGQDSGKEVTTIIQKDDARAKELEL
ncbi:MAG: hypothetical protein NTY36_15795 [Deltaproteobacteria bacterium]|nr:hypothetical protein [Deltaproteobacteria bacterium]